jgi:hypothetical protein
MALAAHRSALLADRIPLVLCFERPDLRRAPRPHRHDERQPSAPGNERRGMPWYQQSGAFRRRAAVNHQVR